MNKEPTGLYRSDDAGATWRKVNNENPRPMYFSQVRVDPNDPDVVIYGGVDLHMTTDGGKTVNTAAATKIHSDHHAIWFDPSNSNHVMIGNDGGLAVSYDHAATWNFLPNVPVGLFYHVSYDMATPFHVCGGMQDNYVWCGPSAVRGVAGIANYQWTTMQGGDGFMALQDPADFRIAYSESQDGNMVRIDRVTNETMSIRPQAAAGRAAAALGMGHAAHAVAARSEDRVRAGAEGVSIGRSRPHVDRDQPRPHDRREPRRHRDDGREGERHPHLERRRRAGVAGDRVVRRVAEARRAAVRGQPTTAICR